MARNRKQIVTKNPSLIKRLHKAAMTIPQQIRRCSRRGNVLTQEMWDNGWELMKKNGWFD